MVLSRREFFEEATTGVAVAGFLAAHGAELDASPLGLPIGSQTWPHREAMRRDLRGLLKQLADLGVRQIELCSPLGYEEFAGLPKPAELKRILADIGLTCGSAHFSMKELREAQSASIAWAKDMGITQMITATLGRGNNPTMQRIHWLKSVDQNWSHCIR